MFFVFLIENLVLVIIGLGAAGLLFTVLSGAAGRRRHPRTRGTSLRTTRRLVAIALG